MAKLQCVFAVRAVAIVWSDISGWQTTPGALSFYLTDLRDAECVHLLSAEFVYWLCGGILQNWFFILILNLELCEYSSLIQKEKKKRSNKHKTKQKQKTKKSIDSRERKLKIYFMKPTSKKKMFCVLLMWCTVTSLIIIVSVHRCMLSRQTEMLGLLCTSPPPPAPSHAEKCKCMIIKCGDTVNVEVKVTRKNSAINLLLASVLSSSIISWVTRNTQLMGSIISNWWAARYPTVDIVIPNWWAALCPTNGQRYAQLMGSIIPN